MSSTQSSSESDGEYSVEKNIARDSFVWPIGKTALCSFYVLRLDGGNKHKQIMGIKKIDSGINTVIYSTKNDKYKPVNILLNDITRMLESTMFSDCTIKVPISQIKVYR
uniref:Transposase n=1 Tax=Strongyloides venezuelensis TaxID=75913 RepID=A0A0K0ETV2_STRVS